MTVVCDMGPLHYLILIEAEHILSQLFDRVHIPQAVHAELSHPHTPEPVRRWAVALPSWVEVKEPTKIEDIPLLGRRGLKGAGEPRRASFQLIQE